MCVCVSCLGAVGSGVAHPVQLKRFEEKLSVWFYVGPSEMQGGGPLSGVRWFAL